MIIFLIAAIAIIVLLWYLWREDEIGALLIWGAIWIVAHGIVWMCSYESYVNARTFYDITKQQYSESIVMYEGKAVLNINEKSFTDMRYKGYQDNMAEMIKTLRENIVDYNTTINQKRIYGKNIFFNWYIIQPDDDMKTLRLKEVQ